jgi:hypothetical protein
MSAVPPSRWSRRSTRASRGETSHKGNFARGKIVDSADHTSLIHGYHFGQDRLRVLQAPGIVAHIGDNGALKQPGGRQY